MKNTSIAVAAVALIVSLIAVFHKTPIQTIVQTPAPIEQPVRGTTPEVDSPYFMINGVTKWYAKIPFNSVAVAGVSTAQGTGIASTTLCSFPVPRIGSSTIEFVSFKMTNAATSTVFLQIATSTSPSATTSPLGGFSSITSAGSTTPQIHWNPQSTATSFGGYVSAAAGTTTFPLYVNVGYSSSAVTLGSLNGVCQIQFSQDQ